ncbi:hypothetical protein HDV00_011371 [Rhizophlyctis rosea]|nr:hypothetical protein HDV00_011371 [Rhizophlyctis rosea]
MEDNPQKGTMQTAVTVTPLPALDFLQRPMPHPPSTYTTRESRTAWHTWLKTHVNWHTIPIKNIQILRSHSWTSADTNGRQHCTVRYLYHGTLAHNITPITTTGYRERGPVRGVWLAPDPNISVHFARGSGKLILNCVLVDETRDRLQFRDFETVVTEVHRIVPIAIITFASPTHTVASSPKDTSIIDLILEIPTVIMMVSAIPLILLLGAVLFAVYATLLPVLLFLLVILNFGERVAHVYRTDGVLGVVRTVRTNPRLLFRIEKPRRSG